MEIKQHDIPCLNNRGRILFSSSQHCQMTYTPTTPFPTSTAPPPLKTSQDRSSDRGLGLKRPGRAAKMTKSQKSEHQRSLHKDVLWPAPPQEEARGQFLESCPGVTAWREVAALDFTIRFRSQDRQTPRTGEQSSIHPVKKQPALKVGAGYGRGPPGVGRIIK